MKTKKTRRLYLRLTESEFSSIKKRAEKFDSLTHFILTAINDFGDTTIKERLEMRKRLAEFYSKAEQILSHVGGNLNQAMRQVNEAAKIAHPTQTLILNRLKPQIEDCLRVCLDLRKDVLQVTKEAVK